MIVHVFKPSFKRFNAFFWPLRAFGTHTVPRHISRPYIQTHLKKEKKKRKKKIMLARYLSAH